MTDAQAPPVTDYDELIGRLELPTKVRLLTAAPTFQLYAEESIGLGKLRLSDGPTRDPGTVVVAQPVDADLPGGGQDTFSG